MTDQQCTSKGAFTTERSGPTPDSRAARRPLPLAISIADTCEQLGLGRTKVYKLIQDNQLKSVKLGGRRLVITSSIEELLASSSN